MMMKLSMNPQLLSHNRRACCLFAGLAKVTDSLRMAMFKRTAIVPRMDVKSYVCHNAFISLQLCQQLTLAHKVDGLIPKQSAKSSTLNPRCKRTLVKKNYSNVIILVLGQVSQWFAHPCWSICLAMSSFA